MKILYLSLSYVPSRRASSVQVMKMCDAFATQGHEVTLVTKSCPEREQPDVQDDYAFYGVGRNFEVLKLPRPERRGGGLMYLARMANLLRSRRSDECLVFSRDLGGALLALFFGYRVIFESHGLPAGRVDQAVFRRVLRHPKLVRVVFISDSLYQDCRASFPDLRVDRVVVAHDGADAPNSAHRTDEGVGDRIRRAGGTFQVGYVGSLYRGKGMEVVVEVAKHRPEYTFHVVGGNARDLARWKETNPPASVVFHGFVPHGELKAYFDAFDALVLPAQHEVLGATGQSNISRWMSPLKLFEYMSAGKPVVSSDLPVLREVLTHEENALLAPPEDITAWAGALDRLAADPGLRERLGHVAQADLINHYTWDARARRVLEGLAGTPATAAHAPPHAGAGGRRPGDAHPAEDARPRALRPLAGVDEGRGRAPG